VLRPEEFTLNKVPDIQDIRSMLDIMRDIGSTFRISENVLKIQTSTIKNTKSPLDLVKRMRASILLIGPLLARAGEVQIGFPGGCVLGKRPIDTHLDAFREMGVSIREDGDDIFLEATHLKPGKVILKEISVTATENILMLAAGINGETEIRLAAQEPHVQDLCHFLIS